jgi:uncharacterized protein (TIGR03435 family)
MPILHKVILLAAIASTSLAQTPSQLPKPGSPAPPLAFTRVFGASPGAKTNLPSLNGKVVVLEFWATWCSPCVADIPVLNSLAASLDPAKVQFISIDDEDPALVERFLAKHPISGWVGLDTTGKTLEAYGVLQRPTTIVIGPDGRVATSTARPETLRRVQLMALAEGKPADFTSPSLTGSASPEAFAERKAILAQKFSALANSAPGIAVTPGEPGDTHIMMRGTNQLDITNATPLVLLQQATGIPQTRIAASGPLPETHYNLHVDAPNLTHEELIQQVAQAVAAATGVQLKPTTATVDVYLLTAQPGAKNHTSDTPYPGFVNFSRKAQRMQAVNGTFEQLAAALEKALGAPVVDETALPGKLTFVEPVTDTTFPVIEQWLESKWNLKLVPAKRPVTTYVVAGSPAR